MAGLDEKYNFDQDLFRKGQYLFFPLNFSQENKDLLNKAKIKFSGVFGANLSSLTNIHESIYSFIDEVLDCNKVSKLEITSLIINLIKKVKLLSKCNNIEIVLRSEKAHEQDISLESKLCYYWHLDKKTHPDSSFIYLHVLKGESTIYYEANDSEKEKLISIANQTNFFYGHVGSICEANDQINSLFDESNKISVVPSNYGSVHLLGENGAIHTAPSDNQDGRLLLMVTPFNCNLEDI